MHLSKIAKIAAGALYRTALGNPIEPLTYKVPDDENPYKALSDAAALATSKGLPVQLSITGIKVFVEPHSTLHEIMDTLSVITRKQIHQELMAEASPETILMVEETNAAIAELPAAIERGLSTTVDWIRKFSDRQVYATDEQLMTVLTTLKTPGYGKSDATFNKHQISANLLGRSIVGNTIAALEKGHMPHDNDVQACAREYHDMANSTGPECTPNAMS